MNSNSNGYEETSMDSTQKTECEPIDNVMKAEEIIKMQQNYVNILAKALEREQKSVDDLKTEVETIKKNHQEELLRLTDSHKQLIEILKTQVANLLLEKKELNKFILGNGNGSEENSPNVGKLS